MITWSANDNVLQYMCNKLIINKKCKKSRFFDNLVIFQNIDANNNSFYFLFVDLVDLVSTEGSVGNFILFYSPKCHFVAIERKQIAVVLNNW